MELLQVAAGVLLLLALVAMVVVWALWKRSRGAAARLIANAEKEAKRIVAKGEIEGQRIQKDVEILARERLLAARTEFERETRDLRVELSGLANRLEEQEKELDERGAELTDRRLRLSPGSEQPARHHAFTGAGDCRKHAVVEHPQHLGWDAGQCVHRGAADLHGDAGCRSLRILDK